MQRRRLIHALVLLTIGPAALLSAQSSGPATDRVLGTVTAMSDGSVTVHPSTGADLTVTLAQTTRLLEAEPGAKTLAGAKPITAADLAVGDRVLIRFGADSQAGHPVAALLIAMKQAAISQVHEQQTADWRRNGVAGIVAGVDPVSGTVTLKPHTGIASVILHTDASTVFREYAPDSTSFADTKPSTIAAIHPGDQIRARGAKDASGSSMDAAEIVTGSFRDIAGTVISVDSSANTITLNDLKTKKPMTLALGADTQLRRLPLALAERLAHAADHTPQSAAPGGMPPHAPAAEGAHEEGESDLLAHAPSIPLADLKKGEAVMVVASGPGAPKPTAITIVAGVEPLLQAPAEASEGLFSASWNLGGGGSEEGGSQP